MIYPSVEFIFVKLSDMHFVKWTRNGNSNLFRLLYIETYSVELCPKKRNFVAVHLRLRECGAFLRRKVRNMFPERCALHLEQCEKSSTNKNSTRFMCKEYRFSMFKNTYFDNSFADGFSNSARDSKMKGHNKIGPTLFFLL